MNNNLKLIEGSIVVYDYTFDKQEKFKAFKEALTYFLAYVKYEGFKPNFRLYKPNENDPDTPIYLASVKYLSGWIAFLLDVYNFYGESHGIRVAELRSTIQTPPLINVEKAIVNLSYTDLCEEFKIEPVILQRDDMYRNKWGSRYWTFLHNISIVCQMNSNLTTKLANLMLNLGKILPCSECASNYRKKDPLVTVTIPMTQTMDSITVMFNLHTKERLDTGGKTISIEESAKWNELTIVNSKTVKYSQIIKLLG